MQHRTPYKGDISKLRGYHVLHGGFHTFYASSDTALREANVIDEALEEAGIDFEDPELGYEVGACPPSCTLRG